MKLKFYARPGYMLSMPGPRVAGTKPQYIGRTVLVADQQIANPAIKQPTEIDSTSPAGIRIMRVMLCDGAEYPLWPADEATAGACGVPYVDVEYLDGEWHPQKAQAKAAKPRAEVA